MPRSWIIAAHSMSPHKALKAGEPLGRGAPGEPLGTQYRLFDLVIQAFWTLFHHATQLRAVLLRHVRHKADVVLERLGRQR